MGNIILQFCLGKYLIFIINAHTVNKEGIVKQKIIHENGKIEKNAEFTKYRKLVRLQRKKSKAKNVRETQKCSTQRPIKVLYFYFILFYKLFIIECRPTFY